jgi:hypothetical protein
VRKCEINAESVAWLRDDDNYDDIIMDPNEQLFPAGGGSLLVRAFAWLFCVGRSLALFCIRKFETQLSPEISPPISLLVASRTRRTFYAVPPRYATSSILKG